SCWIIVTGGIADQHNTRSHRRVDPSVGVWISLAWSCRSRHRKHFALRHTSQPKCLQEILCTSRANKLPPLIQGIAEIKTHVVFTLGKDVEGAVSFGTDCLFIDRPFRDFLDKQPAKEMVHRVRLHGSANLAGDHRSASVRADNETRPQLVVLTFVHKARRWLCSRHDPQIAHTT